jgi:hypothetical protein
MGVLNEKRCNALIPQDTTILNILVDIDRNNSNSGETILVGDQYSQYTGNYQLNNGYNFTDMNNFYSKIDVGIYFLKKVYSKKSSCPTKLGELIATNTPFITNSGIGDINKIFLNLKVNEFLIDKINESKLAKINKKILRIKNRNLIYNSRSELKNFFCQNINLNKYLSISESFTN